MACSLVIIRLSEILRKMSIPDLSCFSPSPVDRDCFPTQSHRRHLLYLLHFRKEEMNASQERQEDASSQNEQQEKTLTLKKCHFYIFPGELKMQQLYRPPQELLVLWFFWINLALRTVLRYCALWSYSVSRGGGSPRFMVIWEDSHVLNMLRRAPPK